MVALAREDVRRVLDDDGRVLSGVSAPEIPEADLRRLYEKMLLVRVLDERMMRLQRQGRLGFYMKSLGEEATHFTVYPLRDSDWVLPSYREPGAWLWRGYSLEDYINQLYGNAADKLKGRQMPVHHSASALNIVSISSPVGTQIPQAAGVAHAAKISGKDDVAMTYFGEGTTSTGEFHVGLNFAGVYKAPVVFVCRNNGWAISVPRAQQTAATSFAAKAIGYGMPGVQVDGNDLLAVIQVATEAVERARAGEGPTLIEALTYRVQAHSSSDDPSAYRDPDEPRAWEKRDPLARFRKYLASRDLWSEELEKETTDRYNDEISRVVEKSDGQGLPAVDTLFDDVYEQPTSALDEQRDYLLSQPRVRPPHGR